MDAARGPPGGCSYRAQVGGPAARNALLEAMSGGAFRNARLNAKGRKTVKSFGLF